MIPIKCFTCGTIIAHKYKRYREIVEEKKKNSSIQQIYLTSTNIADQGKTVEGEALDSLHLIKECCRRHMLSHVDVDY
jgi:DNA-directed RNA polymerase subunit N (RpoN/RPB10)